jgi:chemotaxis protein methyltransferase CheR
MSSALRKAHSESEFVFTDDDYRMIVDLVHKTSGIALGSNKFSMVYARLGRRLRELKLTRFEDYCDLLTNDPGGAEVMAFTNAMTTNLTRFFRENHHFEHLAGSVLPAAQRNNKDHRLRIWSAGCSSGEEPYSIGMTLLEHFPGLPRWDAKILATDLDTNMLSKASKGLYGADALQEVPRPIQERYFQGHPDGSVVKDSLRKLIAFKPLNLLHPWPMKGPFDAIFCRNVMIYFDNPTKTELVQRFARLLRPGGILYVGHAETLLDLQSLYKLEGRTTYRRL